MLVFIEYGCTCENVKMVAEVESVEEAASAAYEMAKESYESYAGLHGMQDLSDVAMDLFDMDLDDLSEEEQERCWDEYQMVIEDDIEYSAEVYDASNPEHVLYLHEEQSGKAVEL